MEAAEDLCRICDKPSLSAKMFDIFDKNADGKQILKLIRESLPVVIFRRDPLSKRICEGCYENIRRIHAFRRASLDIVNKQRERLKLLQNEDVLLYLDTVNSTDQNELWMFSSPIKKDMGSVHLCHKCKTESPLSPPPPPPPPPQAGGKPFRKYKEAVRKLDRSRSATTIHVNGYGGNDDPIDLDAEDTTPSENIAANKKLPMKRLHKASHTYGSFPKRQRIMGPKSKTQPFIRTFYRKVGVYNPLSLLMCCINVVNKQNLPNADCKTCERSEKMLETYEYVCEYCLKEFADVRKLAEHELEHIALKVDRVDNLEIWSSSIEGAPVRNKWLRENNEKTAAWQDFDEVEVAAPASANEEEEDDDQNLLMPLVETDNNEAKGEIILVDGKPTVNGVPLSDIPKTQRRLYYNRTYNMNGVKRKFCPLCRYTFKDNWAIELHYFSSACYYTCRFCGIRFNKQRAQFDEHTNQHIEYGDVMTDKVFAARKKNDPIPKVLCETRSTARQQTNYTTSATNNNAAAAAAAAAAQAQKVYPKIKPLKMKQLLEKSNMSVKTTLDAYNDSNNAESKQNQAYFCRKCFKVFFKLDEFNSHVSNCSEYPESDSREVNYRGEEEPPRKYQRYQRASPTNSRSDESFSSTGRPIRNCVKDVTYRDTLDLDVEGEEEEEEDAPNSGLPFKGIECGLCSAVFPTIPSRNSHMRIHKNGFKMAAKSHAIFKSHKSINIAQKVMNAYHHQQQQNNYSDGASYSKYDPDIPIKQEPLEPLVEIHESNSVHDTIPSSIGAVSITPIPNKMQKTNINPDIMKLVQSNPNITIRSMHQPESPMSDNNQLDDSIRSYKCSSCSKMFSNKSNLYFHKKNHCEGSRYPCPFCKKRFGTEAAYSSHIFYSHPE